uniref:His-Xaa-Ser system protein HxsD n=1 Tax=Loa loa TaxID=7209 RepID=A0A1I7VBD7_LOALO
MAATNYFSTTAINFPEMVIEFNESEFNEEMEIETVEVLHYDTFLLYARSENLSDRAVAIRDLSKLSRMLNIEKEQRRIEVVFSLIENVFAKETGTFAVIRK